MRLYHDLAPSHPKSKVLCSLACEENRLDLCHVGEVWGNAVVKNASELFPMLWRFLPSLDNQVCIKSLEKLNIYLLVGDLEVLMFVSG